ncbi:MAG TPA: PilZ domain-containing protein [Acidobacteriota bacterium]|nr:PilZ domain-containing protein [Acidobacteriota bacterium]
MGQVRMLNNLRKEKRVPIRLKLHLRAEDSRGRAISANITTVNVSKSGICFQSELPLPLQAGDSLKGELESPQFKTDFHLRVMWINGTLLGGRLESAPANWPIR